MSSVAVIGAGAWGTALAIQAARAGNGVDAVGARPGPRRGDRRQPGEPAPARHAPARRDRGAVDVPDAADRWLCWRCRCSTCAACWHAAARAAPLVVCAKGVETRNAAPAAGDRRRAASRRAGRGADRAELRPRDRRRAAGRRGRRRHRRRPARRGRRDCSARRRSGCTATTTRSARRSAGRRRTSSPSRPAR